MVNIQIAIASFLYKILRHFMCITGLANSNVVSEFYKGARGVAIATIFRHK